MPFSFSEEEGGDVGGMTERRGHGYGGRSDKLLAHVGVKLATGGRDWFLFLPLLTMFRVVT